MLRGDWRLQAIGERSRPTGGGSGLSRSARYTTTSLGRGTWDGRSSQLADRHGTKALHGLQLRCQGNGGQRAHQKAAIAFHPHPAVQKRDDAPTGGGAKGPPEPRWRARRRAGQRETTNGTPPARARGPAAPPPKGIV